MWLCKKLDEEHDFVKIHQILADIDSCQDLINKLA
jgi:hypothetical protein